jgi:hypothetical protein
MSSRRRRPEDTADGCRAFATSDHERALATLNGHVRCTFERSADAWRARTSLLERRDAGIDAGLKAPRSSGVARANRESL